MSTLSQTAARACHLKSRKAFVTPDSFSQLTEAPDVLLATIHAQVRIR